jgi:tetratricopeptide (TPR) repeat protein
VASTGYAEGRDPELVRETLTRYSRAAREVIERHGGQVEKFIGDAVMAEWGAPRTNEDDAERAVRAALEVVHAVTNLGEGLHVRVAVLTGQAAVTLGATDQGMVAGDLVNTAARLQGVAPPDSVLVGETTMQAAASAIVFEDFGEQSLRGKTAPVPAWRAVRVVGETGGRGRSESLEPPFVGREVELRLLKDLVHVTGEERRPRLVSVTGPAGIGKSRLAWEFEKYVAGLVEPIYWHRGRSPSYGDGIAFWALGEMVRRRARLAQSDDPDTTRARIHEIVGEYIEGADATWVEQALLTLLGLEPPPSGGRDSLFAAWRTFFERIAARGTTVLLFEDLHWADDGQLDFIDHLLEWSRDVPLLVITLARPELLDARPGWGTSARSFNAIGLEPLTDANMRGLLHGLVHDLPEQTIEQVLARADGIPLYAVEMVRMLIADGRLEALPDGTYRSSGELGELALPDTLRALVASRLDGLDTDDRALIQDATVLGHVFDHRALARIRDQDEDAIEARLRAMVRRELLEISAHPESPERGQFGFVQSVIREVAYETLSRRDRRTRHLAAARYYESAGDEELAAALATHYLAAYKASDEGPEADALRVQARLALRGAAERAMTLGSPDHALAHVVAALEITDGATEQAELLFRAADAAHSAARLEDAEQYAAQAIAIFEQHGDQRSALQASAALATIQLDAGRLEEAKRGLLAASARAGDDEGEIRADLLARLARAHMRLDEADEALAAADAALALAEPLRLDRVVAEALVNKGSAQGRQRRFHEPMLLLRGGGELAATAGDVSLQLRAALNLAVGMSRHDLPLAMTISREALELARRLGLRVHVHYLTSMMPLMMVEGGQDWDDAIAMVDEALEHGSVEFSPGLDHGCRYWYKVLRGEDTAEVVAEMARVLAASDLDPFLRFDHVAAYELMLVGRDVEAIEAFRRAIPAVGFSAEEAMQGLAMAACVGRDLEAARDAQRHLRDSASAGNAHDATRTFSAAVVAALEGRNEEAVQDFVQAVDRYREAGWHFVVAEVQALAVRAMPGRPEFEGWASEARDRFEQLRATPFLRWLDDAGDTAEREEVMTS